MAIVIVVDLSLPNELIYAMETLLSQVRLYSCANITECPKPFQAYISVNCYYFLNTAINLNNGIFGKLRRCQGSNRNPFFICKDVARPVI